MCNLLKITGILMRFHCPSLMTGVCALQVVLLMTRPASDRQHLLSHWNSVSDDVCLMMCFLLCAFFLAFSTGTLACTITECQWVLFEPSCFTRCVASHLSSWGIEAHLGSTFSVTSFPSSAAQLSIKQQFHYGTLWHFLNLTCLSQLRSSN